MTKKLLDWNFLVCLTFFATVWCVIARFPPGITAESKPGVGWVWPFSKGSQSGPKGLNPILFSFLGSESYQVFRVSDIDSINLNPDPVRQERQKKFMERYKMFVFFEQKNKNPTYLIFRHGGHFANYDFFAKTVQTVVDTVTDMSGAVCTKSKR